MRFGGGRVQGRKGRLRGELILEAKVRKSRFCANLCMTMTVAWVSV